MTVMSLTHVSDDLPVDRYPCVSRPPGGLFQRRPRKVGSLRGQSVKRAVSVYVVFKETNNFIEINFNNCHVCVNPCTVCHLTNENTLSLSVME